MESKQMNDIDRNSQYLIDWWERLAPIVNGQMGEQRDLCRDLAQRMDELGNASPSNAAIIEAQRWEEAILRGEKPWVEATP